MTVNRDVAFGVERATAVVNMGRFRPDDVGNTGIEQVVDSIGLDIGYSNSADNLAPQITQTGAVQTAPMTFTAFVRVSDDSGSLHRVAVLYNTGAAVWQVKELTNAGGDLWTGNITTTSPGDIVLDAEAQDNAGNVGFSFNKAVNFQSVPDTGDPSLLVSQPLPNTTYTLNQQVRATFDCSDAGAVSSCQGATDGGAPITSGGLLDTTKPGPHTFVVTGVDLAGNTTNRSISYIVKFVFPGFQSPVDNPPVINVDNAGRTIPVKWALRDAAGRPYANLNAVLSISSKAIKCPSATTDAIENDVPIGLSGLKLTGTDFQFNWSTDKKWAGTCRRLYLHLSDLTLPYADFQFEVGPHRSRHPGFEEVDRPGELAGSEPERLRVGNLPDDRRRVAVLDRVQDIAHRQSVRHHEDRPLRPREDRPVGLDVAAHGLGATVASAWSRFLGAVRVRPGAVLGQGTPLELAEADVVQLRHDEARDLAALQCEVGGLLRSLELRDDAEPELVAREQLAEPAGLFPPGLGEGASRARVAVRAPDDGELAFAVTGEDDRVHGRYATAFSRV